MHRPALTFLLSFVMFLAGTWVLYRSPRLSQALEQVGGGESRIAAAARPKSPRDAGKSPGTDTPSPRQGAMSHRVQPHQPAETYTRARAGESLRDVAERVYGSAEFTHALWQANRDQVADVDQDPAAGLVLRTPRL